MRIRLLQKTGPREKVKNGFVKLTTCYLQNVLNKLLQVCFLVLIFKSIFLIFCFMYIFLHSNQDYSDDSFYKSLTGVANAHGPSPQPTACRSPLCSLTTPTWSNQSRARFELTLPKKSEVDGGAISCQHILVRWWLGLYRSLYHTGYGLVGMIGD